MLQAKSNDIVVGFDLIMSLIDVISNVRVNIDSLFGEWYKNALELAQVSVDETKPRIGSKQTDRENNNVNSIADYYKVSLAIPLIDTVLSKLNMSDIWLSYLTFCFLFWEMSPVTNVSKVMYFW